MGPGESSKPYPDNPKVLNGTGRVEQTLTDNPKVLKVGPGVVQNPNLNPRSKVGGSDESLLGSADDAPSSNVEWNVCTGSFVLAPAPAAPVGILETLSRASREI